MTLFADRFRVESSRLNNWDYSSPWWYFVTICTLNHNKFFGKIINSKIELSERGLFVEKNIFLMKKKFPNVFIDEFVIMPNHVHILCKLKYQHIPFVCRDGINAVSTEKIPIGFRNKRNQMTEKGLSRIIQWLKAKTTFEIRKDLKIFFAWQSRFYDEIIKDEERLKTIKYYIKNNPKNWQKDKLYSEK
jgi:putative transposase